MPRTLASTALVAGLAFSGLVPSVGAYAQGTPPAWDTLVRCAQTPDETERLACYDAAMRSAGYAPNPTAVAEDRRKKFGLSVPKVNVFKHHKKEEGSAVAGVAPPIEENADRVDVTVDQIAVSQPTNKVIIFTTDGQIWQQTDTTQINTYPKEGDTLEIRKEILGGYMCDVNKYQSVNCKRVK